VQGDRKWKSDLQETETQRKLIFVKKKLWKHCCIKSQNDRTKKMSSLLRPEADCVCCKDTEIDPEETKGFKLP
jgi:hypothetical protein